MPKSHKCPENVPRMSQICPKSVPKVSRKCPESVPKVSRKCPESVPKVSRKCPKSVSKVSWKWLKNVPKMSRKCPESVSKVSQKCLKSVPFKLGPGRSWACLSVPEWIVQTNTKPERVRIGNWRLKIALVSRHCRIFNKRLVCCLNFLKNWPS